MNILFIGNSYTYFNDLEQLFQKLCRENGILVDAFRVTKGGRKLISYLDPEDPVTQKLAQILRERHYDICFIQEQSLLPITDFDTFLEGASFVKRMVGTQADRFYLYATWGRKTGSPDLEAHGWTPESMTDLLEDAYNRAGKKMRVPVSPVGRNFWKVISRHPELDLHHTDLTHPSYLGSCLSALTHYHTVFGQFPKNTDSLGLDAQVIDIFRTAICE